MNSSGQIPRQPAKRSVTLIHPTNRLMTQCRSKTDNSRPDPKATRRSSIPENSLCRRLLQECLGKTGQNGLVQRSVITFVYFYPNRRTFEEGLSQRASHVGRIFFHFLLLCCILSQSRSFTGSNLVAVGEPGTSCPGQAAEGFVFERQGGRQYETRSSPH